MAERAVEILRLSEIEYTSLSEISRGIADKFRWEQIAADTAQKYSAALAQIKPAGQLETEVISV